MPHGVFITSIKKMRIQFLLNISSNMKQFLFIVFLGIIYVLLHMIKREPGWLLFPYGQCFARVP